MERTLLSIPITPKLKNEPKPLLTYVILLDNGNTVEQKAHDWAEQSGDEGEGIAYIFFLDKKRVLHIEYSEVRAVLCAEHCDVAATLKALTAPKKAPRKKVSK